MTTGERGGDVSVQVGLTSNLLGERDEVMLTVGKETGRQHQEVAG